MPRRYQTRNSKDQANPKEQAQASLLTPSLTPPPRNLPKLPKPPKPPSTFRKCNTYQQILELAKMKTSQAKRVPQEPQSDLIQPLPDALLIPQDEIQSRLDEQLKHPDFGYEVCEFPDHNKLIQRLTIENELLKQQLTYEKVKNANLAGELSKFKSLAQRVLYGDKFPKSWNSRREALILLVGGLLGLSTREVDEQDNINTTAEEADHRMFLDTDVSGDEEVSGTP